MQIVSCIKREGTNTARNLALQKTHTDEWQHLKTQDVWWKTSADCFHCKKAVSDSSASQIANMQHTHRCMRHHGVLMPECPSQWGCPVKSLGMSALLCFYTQVERWIWSQCETRMQETQKCQYSACSPSNINNWQMEIKTHSVGQRNQGPYGTTTTKVWDK